MRTWPLSLAILAMAFGPFSLACPQLPNQAPPPPAVAVVNGTPIFAYQVQRALNAYSPGQGDRQGCRAIAAALLEDLILERILLDEATRLKVKVSPEEIAEAVKQTTQGYRPYDFQRVLDHVYLSPEMLRKRLANRLRIERLIESQVPAVEPPSDAALRAYFEQHLDRYRQDEQVRARQILVRSREEAEQIKLRLRKEPFEELARSQSVAPEANRGGDLGYFSRGTMPPIFDEVCFTLNPSEISEVITSEYGFHLFQVVEKKPAVEPNFDQLKDKVKKHLVEETRRAAAQKYVDNLKNKASLLRNPELLVDMCVAETTTPSAAGAADAAPQKG